MNKEECLKALCRIQCRARPNEKCEECECFDDKVNIWKCVENTDESLMIRELIEDHFDNTYGFKGFKLHSDSTLKALKKDELIHYIHMVYHNWRNSDWSYNNVMKYAESLQKRIYELELKEKQWIETEKDYRDELKDLKSNPPLKFEELHEEMWVWENNGKGWFCVHQVYAGHVELYTHRGTFLLLKYQPNRFYRHEVKADG